MKKLFLIRHAKSDWNYKELPDIDRSLNLRGYMDAHRAGKWLLEKKLIPEKIIASPAIRTVSTALILASEMKYAANRLEINPELYEKGVSKYIECIQETEDTIHSIAIVGHNPLIAETAYFTDGQLLSFPTCCIAVYQLDIGSWKGFSDKCGKRLHLFFPKQDGE